MMLIKNVVMQHTRLPNFSLQPAGWRVTLSLAKANTKLTALSLPQMESHPYHSSTAECQTLDKTINSFEDVFKPILNMTPHIGKGEKEALRARAEANSLSANISEAIQILVSIRAVASIQLRVLGPTWLTLYVGGL